MKGDNNAQIGCTLIAALMILLVVVVVAVQYLGALIGALLIIGAVRMRRKEAWQNEHGKMKAIGMIAVGLLLGVGQVALLYDKYKTDHPDGIIPEKLRGTWASDLISCKTNIDAQIKIEENNIIFYSGGRFSPESVTEVDNNTFIFKGRSAASVSGDTVMQVETVRISLSNDGNGLQMDEYSSVRCPTTDS